MINTILASKYKVASYIIVAVLAIVGVGVLYDHVESKGFSRGVLETDAKYVKIILDRNEAQSKKVDKVLEGLNNLSNTSIAQDTKLSSDMKAIRTAIKSPMVVYDKSTGCTLSKQFLDSREKAINRANEK